MIFLTIESTMYFTYLFLSFPTPLDCKLHNGKDMHLFCLRLKGKSPGLKNNKIK